MPHTDLPPHESRVCGIVHRTQEHRAGLQELQQGASCNLATQECSRANLWSTLYTNAKEKSRFSQQRPMSNPGSILPSGARNVPGCKQEPTVKTETRPARVLTGLTDFLAYGFGRRCCILSATKDPVQRLPRGLQVEHGSHCKSHTAAIQLP